MQASPWEMFYLHNFRAYRSLCGGMQMPALLLFLMLLFYSHQIMSVFILWCPCWRCALCFPITKKVTSPITVPCDALQSELPPLKLSPEIVLSKPKDTCNSTRLDLVCLRIVFLVFPKCAFEWNWVVFLISWLWNCCHCKSNGWYHSASLWHEAHH